jgi:hypothetical protein
MLLSNMKLPKEKELSRRTASHTALVRSNFGFLSVASRSFRSE